MGCSATQRVGQVKQPRGGYLNPKDSDELILGPGIEELPVTKQSFSRQLFFSSSVIVLNLAIEAAP